MRTVTGAECINVRIAAGTLLGGGEWGLTVAFSVFQYKLEHRTGGGKGDMGQTPNVHHHGHFSNLLFKILFDRQAGTFHNSHYGRKEPILLVCNSKEMQRLSKYQTSAL